MLVLERLFPANPLTYCTGIFSLSLSISISVSLSLSISRLLTESAKASSRTRELLPRGGYSFVEPRKKKDPSLSTRAAETCHPSRDSFFFPPFVFFLPFYTTVRLISDPVFLEREREKLRAGKKLTSRWLRANDGDLIFKSLRVEFSKRIVSWHSKFKISR